MFPLPLLLLSPSILSGDLAATDSKPPELNWVSPANHAWGSLPDSNPVSLPFTISWDATFDSSTSIPEYQIGTTDDLSPWWPFPRYDPSLTTLLNGFRFFEGTFLTNLTLAPPAFRSFVRGRWSNGARFSRPRAAYFSRGILPRTPPTIRVQPLRFPIPVVRRGPRRLPRRAIRRFSLEADDPGPLVSLSYQIGDGDWQFANDFIPGEISVEIPESDFPDALPGAAIPLRFKAFNGLADSAPTESFSAIVNHPPQIIPNGADPIVHEFGQSIEFPFRVVDQDDDAVSMYYRFDGEGDWTPIQGGASPNVFPGAIFANLDPDVEHTLDVLAFDGNDESEPQAFAFYHFLKKTGSFVRKLVRKGRPTVIEIGKNSLLNTKYPAANLARCGVRAEVRSLTSKEVSVLYRIDRVRQWSKSAHLPLGDQEIFEFGDESEPYLSAGSHQIEFRLEGDGGEVLGEDVLEYTVNAPPSLKLLNADKLAFRSGEPVSLPVQVDDDDGDAVSLWYRFEGQNVWMEVPGGGELPSEAFVDHLEERKGVLELLAWDGCEGSGDAVKIGFAIEEAEPEGEGGEAEEDDGEEGMSPAALVGIVMGVVAVIALGIAMWVVVVQRMRNRKKGGGKSSSSSSTGLLDSE